MAENTKNRTVFPNGINLLIATRAGGTAGSFTFASSLGIEAGDRVGQVMKIPISTAGAVGTIVDLTSEFTDPVASDNVLSNASGTNSTGCLLLAVLYKQR